MCHCVDNAHISLPLAVIRVPFCWCLRCTSYKLYLKKKTHFCLHLYPKPSSKKQSTKKRVSSSSEESESSDDTDSSSDDEVS